MNNNTNVTLTQKIELPSAGKFPNVPASITLRAMSLLDEKKRLASVGTQGIVNLVNSCTIDPQGFDAGNMCEFDLDYAMLALRVLSHGPKYKVSVTCPRCGHTQDEDIDISSLPCKQVDDDFSPSFEIQLPVSGDTLTVHILCFNERERMRAEAQRILTKFPGYEGDPADVLEYIYKIDEVNGEKMPYPMKKQYVESMLAADSVHFDNVYSERIKGYGLDTLIPFTCKNVSCKAPFTRYMAINEEFFRPKHNTL